MDAPPLDWASPPKSLALPDDEVHVWRTELEQPIEIRQALMSLLNAQELERARSFYFERDRDHFVVARGVLRSILAGYLNLQPTQLWFHYQAYGKPALTTEFAELRFNLSHSHDLALLAFTRRREIGLDVEYMREELAVGPIAEHFYSPLEIQMLRALPAHLFTQGFFNCWTRKEAYVKARGLGLSLPLAQFSVSLAPGEPAALMSVGNTSHETAYWSLRTLEPGREYVAAIAVEGTGWHLKCWQWNGERAVLAG